MTEFPWGDPPPPEPDEDDGDYLEQDNPNIGWQGILDGEPYPDGDDGWPQPATRTPDAPTEDSPSADDMFVGAPARTTSPELSIAVPIATAVATVGITWVLLMPGLHQVVSLLVPLTAGAGAWWVWHSTGPRNGAISAVASVGACAAYVAWPPLALLLLVVAIVLGMGDLFDG